MNIGGKLPSVNEAEKALIEAEKLNLGAWKAHSEYVAMACRNIAEKCDDLSAENAYIFGLLHDIGRCGRYFRKASYRRLSLLQVERVG